MIAAGIDYPVDRILEDERIYEAEPADLLAVIRSLDDDLDRVFLVGHNPGLTDLVHELSDTGVGDLPTCAVVELRVSVDSWGDVARDRVRRTWFDTPKGARA
jgi:phosphohistidine phosphatase